MQNLPWLFAVVTAVWFGAMAFRARRNWVPWAGAGALFGLVTATIIMGLGEAAFMPISHEAEVRFRIKTIVATAAVVGILGWLFTLDLQRWFCSLRTRSRRSG
jgi:hypothetical protein